MIRKSDVQWWIQEVRRNPDAAPELVEMLADRLMELDLENERLRDELVGLRRGAPLTTADSGHVTRLQQQVAALQDVIKGQASAEAALIFISDRGQALRMPLSRARILLREKQPALDRSAVLSLRSLVFVRPHEAVLMLTNTGRVARILPHQVPFLLETGGWLAEHDDEHRAINLDPGERVAVAVALPEPPRFWTVVTRRGFARQFLHALLDPHIADRRPVIKTDMAGDEPIAMVNGDRGDLMMITRWGHALRFPHHTVMGPGTIALTMEPDDEVATALSLPDEAEVLLVTASGMALRREGSACKRHTKPGSSGAPFIQAFDVLASLPYAARGALLFLTFAGKLVCSPVADVPLQTRLSKGSQLRPMVNHPAVAVAWVPGALL